MRSAGECVWTEKKRGPRMESWIASTFRGWRKEEEAAQGVKMEGVKAKPGQCGILETR